MASSGSRLEELSDGWFLPYAAAALIHHGRAGLAVECLLEFRHVGDHAVGAIFFGRMRVHRGAQTFGFIARLAAPALAVADEEALLGSQVIQRFELLVPGVILPRHVGQK